MGIQKDSFILRSILKTKNLVSSPSKILNYKLINLHLQSFSKLTIAKFTTCTILNFKLQAALKKLWATTICSTFKPDYQYDKKKQFWTIWDCVQCKRKLSSEVLRAQKDFQSPGAIDFECPQCNSRCQVRWTFFERQIFHPCWSVTQSFTFSKGRKINSIQHGDVCCPARPNKKSAYFLSSKKPKSYDFELWKVCSHRVNSPNTALKPTTTLFGGNGTYCFAQKPSRGYGNEKLFPFMKKFIRQS